MKPLGRKIIRLESVDSTNNYVANLIKEGNIDHGAVILADEQFGGRGQRGAVWQSQPGENLTMSIYLTDVNVSVSQQFQLTQFVSLGIIEFFKKKGVHATIKWPNDIYVGSEKIAGMLIENQLAGDKIKSSIVGIGLNVNQTKFDGFSATSLKLVLGAFTKIEDVLFSLINSINTSIEKYNFDRVILNEDYLQSMYRRNTNSHFLVHGIRKQGCIRGVNGIGKLEVEFEGKLELFDLKEIEYVNQTET